MKALVCTIETIVYYRSHSEYYRNLEDSLFASQINL